MEPGIGHKKFGMAHSGSQLIELQINHKHKMQIPVLFQGCLSQDKFKGLKEFLPLGKGREGGDYVGENMAILHFFFCKDLHVIKGFVGSSRNREKHD